MTVLDNKSPTLIARASAMPGRRSQSAMVIVLGLCAIVAAVTLATTPSVPQTLELTGYSGHIGEWELTASLTRSDPDASRELSGPLKMTHVGWCSQDGPEVKTGALRLRFARLSSGIDVTMQMAGVECAYRGSLSDAYTGMMSCPDKRPVPLTLWLR